ncbi:hypothetical protein N7499_009489 [Penicillium canescens]|uniref:Uncharacterized protein n=1 Tax=Penicillium canescens TaxID=5083 RepID=A0AAD6IQ67_PENCN|nr:uncharacterized protein N7446_008487 [Penicillium canescens]KAJ6019547.1 hypothetical protein N7522_001614 [Penicillium canescens]KAJ6033221.1 hypothetical protein N7444_010992 [Penicillium canescens]KAJ6057588.1 hypothetical protein N7460_000862 [Penicillium canescens]KAJ6058904.1 hypothetical protein N7446_008487 [Penicillium canescens]KAJ6071475.1 hypothetical protein N7499_009489 [Penicillium canescens]
MNNETYEPTQRTHHNVAGGSSTGSPGIPTGMKDSRSDYDPATKGYNPATGSSYEKPTAHRTERAAGQDQSSTTTGKSSMAGSKAGDNLGRGVKGAAASVHGAGESLRGAVNTAVDRAFGSNEGAERNADIARKGEEEIRSGKFVGRS